MTLPTLSSVSFAGDHKAKNNCTHIHAELNVTIRPDYRPAPGEDPGELGSNEFTAGSVLSLDCDVQGNSGSLTYIWSVPNTPDCLHNGCSIDTTSPPASTLRLAQLALTSYHAGDYTCTVSEGNRPDSGNSDTFTVGVVGMR